MEGRAHLFADSLQKVERRICFTCYLYQRLPEDTLDRVAVQDQRSLLDILWHQLDGLSRTVCTYSATGGFPKNRWFAALATNIDHHATQVHKWRDQLRIDLAHLDQPDTAAIAAQELSTGETGSANSTSNEGDIKRKSSDNRTSNEGDKKRKSSDDFPSLNDEQSFILNSYIDQLGFDTSLYKFRDVRSHETWAQAMIPPPVAAVIVLYPLSDYQLKRRKMKSVYPTSDDVWFITDNIGKASGTHALLHVLLNTPESLRSDSIRPDSWLHAFHQDCPAILSPDAKAK
jgi:transposase-like protein